MVIHHTLNKHLMALMVFRFTTMWHQAKLHTKVKMLTTMVKEVEGLTITTILLAAVARITITATIIKAKTATITTVINLTTAISVAVEAVEVVTEVVTTGVVEVVEVEEVAIIIQEAVSKIKAKAKTKTKVKRIAHPLNLLTVLVQEPKIDFENPL